MNSHQFGDFPAARTGMKSQFYLVLLCCLSALPIGCGASDHPTIGEQGILESEKTDAVLAPIDKNAEGEMDSAIAAHDMMGIQQLIAQGKVLQVKTGTKVLVIGASLDELKVRILEGEHSGEVGWVSFELVMRVGDKAAPQK